MTVLPLRDFTAAEQNRLDAIEAASAADEAIRERVARAIFATANPIVEAFPDYWDRVTGGEMTRSAYRRQADAAIAVLRGPSSDAEQAVERCIALAAKHDSCCGLVTSDGLRAAVRGD